VSDRPIQHDPMTAVATGLASAVLGASARIASTGRVGPREERLFRALNDRPGSFGVLAWSVMQSGSLGAVGVVAVGLAGRGRRSDALVTAVSSTGLWTGVKAIKPLIGRGRPDHHLADVVVRGRPQRGLGYPSGHSAVSASLAVVLGRGTPPAVRVVLAGMATMTGVTRMRVGAHLPADVAGGLSLGILWGLVLGRTIAVGRPDR